MATFTRQYAGISNVGSYQVSGKPYITGSDDLDDTQEHKIVFPYITKMVRVRNLGSPDLRVHFASTGSSPRVYDGLHYITLASASAENDSITMNVKCKEIYVSNQDTENNGKYEIFAELTGIETGEMKDGYMTGSGITD